MYSLSGIVCSSVRRAPRPAGPQPRDGLRRSRPGTSPPRPTRRRESLTSDRPAPDSKHVAPGDVAKLAGVQWDDLRVFLAVAQAGSLRRAARALGFGQPTVIRRLRQLEESLGTRLFERTPDGHRLTKGGQHLLPMAQGVADAATVIDRRRMAFGDDAGGVVRVTTGEWVARFLAPHEYFRSMAWLMERLGDRRPQVRASRFSLQVEAIRAGAGLGILPCFVGDADARLVRLTAPITELGADYWLLVHPDLKMVPRVRLLIDWIRTAFKDSRRALQGTGPLRRSAGGDGR